MFDEVTHLGTFCLPYAASAVQGYNKSGFSMVIIVSIWIRLDVAVRVDLPTKSGYTERVNLQYNEFKFGSFP